MNRTVTLKAEATTDEIMQLFKQHGNENYDGGTISQASHMIQCSMKAMENDGDVELILGSFLHDIGLLLKHDRSAKLMDKYGVVNLESLGAAYLRLSGFSERICAMVEMHVQAKRYLVSQQPGYKDRLSKAGWQTLQQQGGPMTENEAKSFREHPFFNDIIKVRYWDEEAKDNNAFLLPMNHFRALILDYLNDQNI